MQTARIFNNGDDQAICLPKEYRFDDDEVIIKKVGAVVLLIPKRYAAAELDALLSDLESVHIERDQAQNLQDQEGL